jgi:hypothetical protein
MCFAPKRRGETKTVPHRVLVITTAASPRSEVEQVIRTRAGKDAEVQIVAPASKISWLDRLTNDEDSARADAAERASAASEELPGDQGEPKVGDVDPYLAIEDALRTFAADEIVIFHARGEDESRVEQGFVERAQERFDLPVTEVVAG